MGNNTNLFESLRGVLKLSDDGVSQVVLEDLFRVLKRLRVALRRAVHPLVAGLIVVGLGAQDQRLD